MKPMSAKKMQGLLGDAPDHPEISTKDLPTTFDWNKKGAVTAIKNQASCGSCWAFSATGNIEGVTFLKTGKLVSLSEQNLVDCDHMCSEWKGQQACDSGCGGGLMWSAFKYVIKNGGIDTEETYDYEGMDDSCRFNKKNVGAKITDWKKLPTDEKQLAAALVSGGPISVAINADPLQGYSGGVITSDECDPDALDHGVLLVGFGTDDNGTQYWVS
jgi:cathepsin F